MLLNKKTPANSNDNFIIWVTVICLVYFFFQDDITIIIYTLDPNKAHDNNYDNISILMLKICASSICEHLGMMFNELVETPFFPSEWKIGNIVLIHKKGDKRTLNNYRPVSLLPICGKILEI